MNSVPAVPKVEQIDVEGFDELDDDLSLLEPRIEAPFGPAISVN